MQNYQLQQQVFFFLTLQIYFEMKIELLMNLQLVVPKSLSTTDGELGCGSGFRGTIVVWRFVWSMKSFVNGFKSPSFGGDNDDSDTWWCISFLSISIFNYLKKSEKKNVLRFFYCCTLKKKKTKGKTKKFFVFNNFIFSIWNYWKRRKKMKERKKEKKREKVEREKEKEWEGGKESM